MLGASVRQGQYTQVTSPNAALRAEVRSELDGSEVATDLPEDPAAVDAMVKEELKAVPLRNKAARDKAVLATALVCSSPSSPWPV